MSTVGKVRGLISKLQKAQQAAEDALDLYSYAEHDIGWGVGRPFLYAGSTRSVPRAWPSGKHVKTNGPKAHCSDAAPMSRLQSPRAPRALHPGECHATAAKSRLQSPRVLCTWHLGDKLANSFVRIVCFMALHSIMSLMTVASAVLTACGETYVGFDSAVASNTYAPGDYTAEKAMMPGSGYWCRRATRIVYASADDTVGCFLRFLQFRGAHNQPGRYLDRQIAQQAHCNWR